MKFKLEIKLGNDAMQTGEDIAGALSTVVKRLKDIFGDTTLEMDRDPLGAILDVNGNVVGSWQIKEG